MINSEKNTYLQETEVRPNRYASLALLATMIFTLSSLILNEMGIFRVGKLEMRVGAIVTIVSVSIPLLMLLINKQSIKNPSTKYIILFAGATFTMSVSTTMTFHTTIMLLFPMFLAMLYRSKPLGYLAFVASMLCTVISPLLGYALGTWDVAFFQELILIATNSETLIPNASPGVTVESIGKIILYIIMPRAMMVGCCSVIMFNTIRIGEKHVQNQLLLNKLSRRDALTGVYNRNYFNELVNSRFVSGVIGVIFFDVNGLKEINDTKGHEYGDLLLRRSAQSLINVCSQDTINAFRLGGDEFLLVMEGAQEADVLRKIEEWQRVLKKINRENEELYDGIVCSVAAGYAIGDFSELEELVNKADSRMYENKAWMKAQRINQKENSTV